MSDKVTSYITTDNLVAHNESRLSICLRSNGFSFSVIGAQELLYSFGEVVFDFQRPLGELAQALKDFFAQHDISTFGMKETKLIVQTDHFAWIPQHLYDSTRDRQYLKMVSELDPSMGVYHMLVPYLQSYIVFSACTTVVTAFKLAIPGIDVHCQHSVMANPTMISRSKTNPIIFMYVGEGKADFDVFFGSQLLLSNRVSASSQNELLYHAIGIMKQLHIETPDLELTICGDVGRDIYALLQHYFPSVTLYTGRPITFENPLFQSFPTYQHPMILS